MDEVVASSMPRAAVSVFVRVRPLTPTELQQGATELPGMRLSSSDVAQAEDTAYDDTSIGGFTAIGGFTGLVGCEAPNQDVFERCFKPQLETVLRGGAASLFCYGYTGSGKTHTVIGYGQEQGLYFLAAAQLLRHLGAAGGDHGLFLRASVCELYNDEVFDLLGPDKIACTLRVDEDGQLQVIGEQTSVALPASETAALEELLSPEERQGLCATMLTRASGLRTTSVFTVDDLQRISSSCVQQRAAGSSTTHAQSSRSHALLRVEVVNEIILEAQAKFEEAKALIAPRKNAVDNVMFCKFKLLWTLESGLFPASAETDKSDYHPAHPDMGFHNPNDGYIADMQGYKNGLIPLKGHEADSAKSLEDWAKHFGVGDLVFGMTRLEVRYDEPGKWEVTRKSLDAMGLEMSHRLHEAQQALDRAAADLEDAKSRGPEALGGSLLLVDLAGADYDHRCGKEQKESAAINKSLLSLKECFRSIAGVSPSKAKFRDSKLTRLLEDSLAPSARSKRRCSESASVMLVNISPAEHLRNMTLNTLRYGQMFAAADNPRQSSSKPASRKSKACTVAVVLDAKIEKEIYALYRQHCPEKSQTDIKAILARFSGKEAELLSKVREKYASVGV